MTQFNILRNKRKEANDFSMEYPCDFCKRFAGQVVELLHPKMDIIDEDTGPREPRICSACLHDMQEAMAKNIRDNFKSDFNERFTLVCENCGYEESAPFDDGDICCCGGVLEKKEVK